jgi:LexA-binding, inner membrane-associated putative hydrolase
MPSRSRARLLSTRTVLICVACIAIADLLIWRWRAPYAIEALFDEPAHLATGLVALAAFGLWFEGPVLLAVLIGSVLIDVDHVPHVLGSGILEHGVPRPYTHSLGTILVVVAALAWLRNRQARRFTTVVALALAVHFVRDAAEPGGPGVSLLWPLSDHGFTIAYGWYAGAIAVLAAVALRRRRTIDQAATSTSTPTSVPTATSTSTSTSTGGSTTR